MEKGLKDLNEKDLIKGSMLAVTPYIWRQGSGFKNLFAPHAGLYIGDAVFEMMIRTLIVEKGQRAANTPHRHTTKIVCAQTQAKLVDAVYESLTEDEQEIYRRGKNTKLHSTAKNASLSDYRKATGFEALCGYLFSNG